MSTSNAQLPNAPTASPLLRIVASGDCPQHNATSTWKDVQQTLSLPTCLPVAVQPLLLTLQPLLFTNTPPSSQDSIIISECLSIIDGLIAKEDAAIALITSTAMHMPGKQSTPFDEQRKQRAHLQHLRKQVHSVDSVVRRLPQEIWQEIFLFVRPCDDENKLEVFYLQDPLYVVGQVCRTWRTASHRHPRLWSQILIVAVRVQSQQEGLFRLRTVLERARSVPLDFLFFSDSQAPQFSIALLSLLTEYSHQWRSAEFWWLTPNEARPLELVYGRVPELRTLRLDFSRKEAADVEPTDLISAFQCAPKLLHMEVRHFPLGQVLLDSSVKQNLQSLDMTYYCEEGDADIDLVPSLFEILCGYPSLNSVDLHHTEESIAWGCEWPAPGAPRTIHTLTSLCAIEGDSLNRISLPNLAELTVGLCTEVLNPGILPCLISLLRHSCCRLTHLVLCSTAWDEQSLGVLLALVQDLNALKLMFGGTRRVDDTLRILSRCLSITGDDGPKYVPRLEILGIELVSIAGRHKWPFIDKGFLDMVTMRAKGCLTVVNLRNEFTSFDFVDVVPVLRGDDLRQWRMLEKDGLIQVHRR